MRVCARIQVYEQYKRRQCKLYLCRRCWQHDWLIDKPYEITPFFFAIFHLSHFSFGVAVVFVVVIIIVCLAPFRPYKTLKYFEFGGLVYIYFIDIRCIS